MSKGQSQFVAIVAVLVALYFALHKKECVTSIFTPGEQINPVLSPTGEGIAL